MRPAIYYCKKNHAPRTTNIASKRSDHYDDETTRIQKRNVFGIWKYLELQDAMLYLSTTRIKKFLEPKTTYHRYIYFIRNKKKTREIIDLKTSCSFIVKNKYGRTSCEIR